MASILFGKKRRKPKSKAGHGDGSGASAASASPAPGSSGNNAARRAPVPGSAKQVRGSRRRDLQRFIPTRLTSSSPKKKKSPTGRSPGSSSPSAAASTVGSATSAPNLSASGSDGVDGGATKGGSEPEGRPHSLSDLQESASGIARRGAPEVHWSHEMLSAGLESHWPAPNAQPAELSVLRKFHALISAPQLDVEKLRSVAWNGVPDVVRPIVWQLLFGYLPANLARREQTLVRKRKEYASCIARYWEVDDLDRTTTEQKVLRQILVDIPRTGPHVPIFSMGPVQRALERILYIWAIKHPASGYVQGMNDLVTTFYIVFLSAFVEHPRSCDVTQLPEDVMSAIEADSYWCLTKLLDGIQDHYTPSQPGVQRMIHRLEELVRRIDAPLYQHLQNEGLFFMQFAFRWMNCLLMREVSLESVTRLWDTYIAEPSHGFDVFHVYVCAAFLTQWSADLRQKSFQDLMIFLQEPPTAGWSRQDIDVLLSQAYVLQAQYAASKAHLR